MLAAVLAVLSAFCGWIAVLVPLGGDPRGSPAFWLLAIPLLCWTTPLLGFRAWAVNTVGLALAAAPPLALAALLTAERLNANRSLLQEAQSLDTPGAMRVVLGVTALFSLAGLVALRRSSLPGGTRPATYLPPGTLPVGVHPITPQMRTALAVGSLTVSGVLINGVFFALTALLDLQNERIGPLWPAAVPLGFAGATLALVIRGGRGLARQTGRSVQDLRRGFRLGATGTGLMLALMWLWPTDLILKLAFSLFMVPTAVAASWGMVSASRRLRDAEMDRPARGYRGQDGHDRAASRE